MSYSRPRDYCFVGGSKAARPELLDGNACTQAEAPLGFTRLLSGSFEAVRLSVSHPLAFSYLYLCVIRMIWYAVASANFRLGHVHLHLVVLCIVPRRCNHITTSTRPFQHRTPENRPGSTAYDCYTANVFKTDYIGVSSSLALGTS